MNVFLIDADNLNSCAYVEEAIRKLEASEGVIHVRRAYGSPSNIKGLSKAIENHSIQPYVNLSIKKNTTDVALAVDAMELACQVYPPDLVVIGSGDADFLPLVMRLKKRGIRTVCISRKICASDSLYENPSIGYDRVILVGEPCSQTTSPLQAASVTQACTNSIKGMVKSVPNLPTHLSVKISTPETRKSIRDIEAKKSLVQKESRRSHSPEIKCILRAAPSLASGRPQPMGIIVKVLRDAGIIGRNSTAAKFFRRLKAYFEHPFGDRQVVRFIC